MRRRMMMNKLYSVRFLRWTITKTEWSTEGVQACEFVIFDENGNRILYPASAKATCSRYENHDNASVQGPDNLIDNETYVLNMHKFYNPVTPPVTITIDISKQVSISQYGYYTADDDYGRDPVSWTLEGSSDGVYYDVIDSRTNISKVSTRNALVGPFSINI